MKKRKILNKKIITKAEKKLISAIILIGDKNICDEFKTIIDKTDIKILDFKKSTPKSVRSYDLICAFEFTNTNLESKKKNLGAIDRLIPKSIPIISSSISVTISTQSNWIKNSEKLIGVSAFPTLISNRLIEIAPGVKTNKKILESVREIFAKLGKETVVVQDRIGMVMPRILAQIINEAFFAIQQNIALPKDIDLAMKLGANYATGPIEWGEKIGFEQIEIVLKSMFEETREERYKISPLLIQFVEMRKN